MGVPDLPLIVLLSLSDETAVEAAVRFFAIPPAFRLRESPFDVLDIVRGRPLKRGVGAPGRVLYAFQRLEKFLERDSEIECRHEINEQRVR